jgi:uncharacterized protein (TIGR02453 family)
MFQGFSQEALDFLLGIRYNNDREWFEPRKNVYTEKVYEPMKALAEEIYAPFADTGMICKAGRIYRDEKFPPYLHYRDTMWIYVRYEAFWWNKTPTLYFELSPDGAEFGFRIAKPEAAVMERFRSMLTEDGGEFLALAKKLKKKGISFGGEEYKRPKKCPLPEAEEFFRRKGLSAYVRVSDLTELSSPRLVKQIIRTFRDVLPLNELFHEIVEVEELSKALIKESAAEPEPEMVKAPQNDFMW